MRYIPCLSCLVVYASSGHAIKDQMASTIFSLNTLLFKYAVCSIYQAAASSSCREFLLTSRGEMFMCGYTLNSSVHEETQPQLPGSHIQFTQQQ